MYVDNTGGLRYRAHKYQVPVIYLVEPNSQNLQIVTSDLSRGLYSLSFFSQTYQNISDYRIQAPPTSISSPAYLDRFSKTSAHRQSHQEQLNISHRSMTSISTSSCPSPIYST